MPTIPPNKQHWIMTDKDHVAGNITVHIPCSNGTCGNYIHFCICWRSASRTLAVPILGYIICLFNVYSYTPVIPSVFPLIVIDQTNHLSAEGFCYSIFQWHVFFQKKHVWARYFRLWFHAQSQSTAYFCRSEKSFLLFYYKGQLFEFCNSEQLHRQFPLPFTVQGQL